MDYAQLEVIQECTEASLACLEAVDPNIGVERIEQIRQNLLKYCKHDQGPGSRLTHINMLCWSDPISVATNSHNPDKRLPDFFRQAGRQLVADGRAQQAADQLGFGRVVVGFLSLIA
jgi:hypothetical protein